MAGSKCYKFKNADMNANAKAIYELNLAVLILAIAAAVVLPLSFALMTKDNTRKFGGFLMVLVWLHIAAIAVLSGFIESKTESTTCAQSPATGGNGAQTMAMRRPMMRAGYAVPPPAF